MTFNDILGQTIAMLQQHGRVSYRALKRQFAIDDDYLEDLKEAILFAHPQVVDEGGRGLVWAVDPSAVALATAMSAPAHERAPLTYTPVYLQEKILASRTALEGERKQVTVLFADIKDSTELIKDLDAEAAQQLLDPALHHMMDAVHRFEGTVNQVLGDGIMAIFGAPIAHEDYALRACYAALAMQAVLRTYADEVRRTHGLELHVRVGLNAGEVVVRTIRNDLHMDYSAVGETTHLAARMEQLATPGTIRITAATLQLAEGLIRVNALGPVPVKGLPAPVEIYEVVGASPVRGRFQAAVSRGLTHFVGRETEIEALQHGLERAGAGHGQVLAVMGEAGVGKSRLVYEFVHSQQLQGWLVLESASVSYGKATPYLPIIDLLKRYAHIEERDDARTMRAKVTGQVLTLDATLQEAVPVLLALLDALPEDNPFQQLDPPQQRQRTLDALKRVLLRESQAQPLVLVVEDLHWIDAETQALLDSLVESLPSARLLLVVNYRPEYRHGWGSKTYYTWQPLAGAAASPSCPYRRGPGSVRRGPSGQAGRTAGAPRPTGCSVGQSPSVLSAGGGEGHGAVGPPRGRGILRAGAECPPASAGDAPHTRAGHRYQARPALRLLGNFGRILAYLREAEAIAAALDDPRRLALRQGDLPRALPLLERAVGICQDADLPAMYPGTAAALGAAYTLSGRVADAMVLLTQAMEQTTATEMVNVQAFCQLSLGDAHLLAGRLEEAFALAERGLALTHRQRRRGNQAYALRLLGDIAARRKPPEVEQSETSYRHALVLAEELGMRPLMAHRHLSLGKLCAASGRRAEAGAELSAAVELYRARDMSFWLPQAEATLEEVKESGRPWPK